MGRPRTELFQLGDLCGDRGRIHRMILARIFRQIKDERRICGKKARKYALVVSPVTI
jgi:hypothetical protein